MKTRKYRFGACHYCVCTACTRFHCPYSHRLYRECQTCHDRGVQSPRLDCDYFSHYLKSRRFKIRRVINPLPDRSGTYILLTDQSLHVGSYEDLKKLSARLGGVPRKLNIIDYNFGGLKNE